MAEETDNPPTPIQGEEDGEPKEDAEKNENDEENAETGEITEGAKALAEELDKIKVEQPTRPMYVPSCRFAFG